MRTLAFPAHLKGAAQHADGDGGDLGPQLAASAGSDLQMGSAGLWEHGGLSGGQACAHILEPS